MIRPPRLREGARVALVSPAGPAAPERIAVAQDRCARFGLVPVFGAHASGKYVEYLAGTDEERLADLHWALTDPEIDAVWAVRGGYGTMRLLRHLDFAAYAAAPRAYIGFSDNTTIHLALHKHGISSFHGPNAGGPSYGMSERVLQRVLFHAEPAGALEACGSSVCLRSGVAEGPLYGGNLSLLASMCGTMAPPRAPGAIFFIEEIGEPAYRIDRAWTQLLLSGALDDVAAIVFGQFTNCGESAEVIDVLRRLSEPLGVPCVAGLPFGHEDDNWTLPMGVRARIDASTGELALLEPAVS